MAQEPTVDPGHLRPAPDVLVDGCVDLHEPPWLTPLYWNPDLDSP